MKQKVVQFNGINVANDQPFVLFGGMNVLELKNWAFHWCLKPVGTKPIALPFIPIVAREWKKAYVFLKS